MENYGGDRQAMLVVSDRSQLLFSSAVTVDSPPPLPLHHYCICKEITRAHIICSTPLFWHEVCEVYKNLNEFDRSQRHRNIQCATNQILKQYLYCFKSVFPSFLVKWNKYFCDTGEGITINRSMVVCHLLAFMIRRR
jgi:hypothetical protein